MSRTVFPGEEIAEEEEYVAAEGTYVKDGKIYASAFGDLHLNDTELTASVVSPNPVINLNNGDIVYARIDDVRKTMASATALFKEGSERCISSSTVGTIHVSKITPDYCADVSQCLRKMDLVRATVIGTKPSLQLSTKGPHLGVIRALCPECRKEMGIRNGGLSCPKCRRQPVPRKLADDYGDVECP